MKNLVLGVVARAHRAQLAVLAALGTLVESTSAHAVTVGDMANNGKGELQGLGSLAVAGSFLGGTVLTCNGLWMLKKASESNGQVPYSQPMMRIAVGAGLASVPALTGTSVASLWGGQTGTAATIQSETFTN